MYRGELSGPSNLPSVLARCRICAELQRMQLLFCVRKLSVQNVKSNQDLRADADDIRDEQKDEKALDCP
jgi:hypothetical protein